MCLQKGAYPSCKAKYEERNKSSCKKVTIFALLQLLLIDTINCIDKLISATWYERFVRNMKLFSSKSIKNYCFANNSSHLLDFCVDGLSV